MEETQKPLVKLTDVSTRYKLNISSHLLDQIEYVCKQLPHLEWSGVLFYKVEGSFEEKNLVLTAVDMLVQDIGSAGATEFELTSDVAWFIAQNDLVDCQMGLIHSHNTMATFFSGTDQNTLLEEGIDRNHFLSLIVNNAGSYSAKVTRKISYKEKYTVSYSYQTYEDVPVDIQEGEAEEEYTVIEAFPLDIVKEERLSPFPELDATLAEIRKRKEEETAKAKAAVIPSTYGYERYIGYKAGDSFKKEVPAGPANKIQKELPFHEPFPSSKERKGIGFNKREEGDEVYIDYSEKEEPNKDIPYDKVHYPEEVIQTVLKKLLKASPLFEGNLNLVKFVSSMEGIYDKSFPTIPDFDEWAGNFVEYLLLLYSGEDKAIAAIGVDEDGATAILAHDLLLELDKLPEENIYLNRYRALLEAYIL